MNKLKTVLFPAVFVCLMLPVCIKGQIYDTMDTASVTASIATVRIGDIRRNAVTSIEETLTGQAAGLFAVKSGGQKFGARNFEFFIRGKATTADASPLLLVDGVEANINLIDFNEIETVSILKDAPALAVYGMRGANGVVMIKTRRGDNTKNTVGLDIRFGLQTPVAWGQSLNSFDYTTLYNEALAGDGGAAIYQPGQYLNNIDPQHYPDVNFGDLFLKDRSTLQQYNFTARGGNQTARYFCLAGYTKQGSLFGTPEEMGGARQKNYERYNFRSNIDVDLGAGFEMSADVLAAFDYNRAPWLNASDDANTSSDKLVDLLINTPPNAFPLQNADGSLGGTSVYLNNPLGILQRSGLRTDEHKLLAARARMSKSLSFITPGLQMYVMYHFENYNTSYKSKYKKFAVFQYNPDAGEYARYGIDDTKTTTAGGHGSDYYRSNNVFAGLEYAQTFGSHRIDGQLFFNRSRKSVGGDVPDYCYQGAAAWMRYGYDERYFAELSAGLQGSNSYLSGKRYGMFPALGVAWIASNEPWLRENAWIDLLKIRLSAGVSGNDRTAGNRFAYRQSWYAGSGYGFGNPNAASDGSYEGALSNEDASWERSRKLNAGVDFRTLQGDLSLTTDVFFERRDHIMVESANSTPSLIGIGLPYINGGVVENKGIDAALAYRTTIGRVGVSLGGNIVFAGNTIVDLKEPAYEYDGMYRRGNAVNTIYGLVADGIYRTPEEIAGAPASSYTTLQPGDIRYVNQNPSDDALINQLDVTAIGNTFPALSYGLHAGIAYRGFDIYCLGRGVAGNDLYLRPSQWSPYVRDNRWQAGADRAQHPRLSLSNAHNTQSSSFWLQSGAYFRINSIEWGYTLPREALSRIAVAGLRVYVNINHPVTFSSEREGRDPEAPQAGYTQYPLLRSYTLGLSIEL
jgi:TonB-linked SusC/RagA family outer membrane protein